MESVDDIADANNRLPQALHSHTVITDIIERKCLKLSIDKCKLLKINGRGSGGGSLIVYREPMKAVELFRYLGDTFNSKGDNVPFANTELTNQWDSQLKLCLCVRKPTLVSTKYIP